MKKYLSIIIFSMLIILTLASCGKNNEEIKNSLNNLNLASFDNNNFNTSFRHQYDAESHTDDEYEKVDYTISYNGNGSLITKIDGLTKDLSNYTFYDLITTKVGYIKLVQYEKINCDYIEIDKTDNNKRTEDKTNYEINHEITIKFDDSTIYISSSSKFNNLEDNTKNVDEAFNGKITKALFTDATTEESINYFYNELVVMSEFSINKSVQKQVAEEFIKSKDLNDKDFGAFVANNNLTIDNTKISFSYPCNSFINSLFSLKANKDSKINGKLTIDGTNKDLTNFEYDLKDFIFNSLDLIDDEDLVKTNINVYTLNGELFNTAISDIKIDKEFKEYTESQSFMNDLFKVIPTYFD